MVEEKKLEEKKKELTLEEGSKLIDLQIRTGKTKGEIRKELIEKGFNEKYFDGEYLKIMMKLEEEEKASELEPGSIFPALLGGVAAAVAAAVIWTAVLVITEYEIGYMALAVGFLVGYGVYFFSGKKRGLVLQVIAALSSVLGIFLAKYFTVYYFLKDMLKTEYGVEAAAEITLWSKEIMEILIEEFSSIFTAYDILWVVFAVIVAWGIPKKLKINRK